MRDVIRDAMTRPDCILGVVPDGGGMWLSPLRPDTPRNFAEKPEEWTDAMTAANQIGSDDWSFQIKMNVLSQIQQTSGEIFNNDSGSPLKIYGDLIASGSAAFYLRNYVELETWTGKHELQLDVVSGNAAMNYMKQTRGRRLRRLILLQDPIRGIRLTRFKTQWIFRMISHSKSSSNVPCRKVRESFTFPLPNRCSASVNSVLVS